MQEEDRECAASKWLTDVLPLLPAKDKPLRCTQHPGEVMYIPEGMFHATYNLYVRNVTRTTCTLTAIYTTAIFAIYVPIPHCTCPRRALLLQMPSLNTLNAYVYTRNLTSVSNEPFSILLTCNVVFCVWCLVFGVTTHSHVHTARTTMHVHAARVHPRDTVTAGVSWQGQSSITTIVQE